jgi:hypothetical protein
MLECCEKEQKEHTINGRNEYVIPVHSSKQVVPGVVVARQHILSGLYFFEIHR